MEFEELNRIPYSLEAERALIGGIFFDINSLDEIKYIIKSDDFYKKEHAEIYKAIENLFSESRGVDPILVVEEIKKSDLKNEEEILQVLTEIIDENTSSYNLLEYAELIKEKAMLRRLGQVGMEITKTAHTDVRTAEEIMDEAESKVLNLSKNILKNSIIDMKTASLDEMRRIDNVTANRGKTLGIPTGFVDLDRMTSGLNNSDLIILAARPAMGKTAFALNLALNAAKEKKNVLIFSLEMPVQQLYQRLLAMESGISQNKLRNVYLEEDEWNKLTLATTSLSNLGIYVADLPHTNVLEIRSYARNMKTQGLLDLIVIDYLQLLQLKDEAGAISYERVSRISKKLKNIAKENNICILCVAQMSRNFAERKQNIKQDEKLKIYASDLKDSSQIEQDASSITGLVVTATELDNLGCQKKLINIQIIKQRYGVVRDDLEVEFFTAVQGINYTRMEKKLGYKKE